ncbi:MAG: hypothetical protein RR356_06810 [Bacteroidales bacterium]
MKNLLIDYWHKLQTLLLRFCDTCSYTGSIFKNEVMNLHFQKTSGKKLHYTIHQPDLTFSLKSKDDIYKYLYATLMMAFLLIMPFMSIKVGISDREITQNNYSEAIYNDLQNGDISYRNIAPLNSQGQSADILIYSIGTKFGCQDIFLLKHIVSSVLGWFIILAVSFFAFKLFCWRAAFFSALFLFISPRFLYFSFGNITDITFTLAFIICLFQFYLFCKELPLIKWKRCLFITLSMIVATTNSSAGFILIGFLFLFSIIYFLLNNPIKQFFSKSYISNLSLLLVILICITIVVYVVNKIYLGNIVSKDLPTPGQAILLFNHFEIPRPQTFEGEIISQDHFPSYMLIKYLFITTPFVCLIGFFLFFFYFRTVLKKLKPFVVFLLLFSFFYLISKFSEIYLNADILWSIIYTLYPLFILLSVSGLEAILRKVNDRYTNAVIIGITFLLTFMPIRHSILNRPLSFIYFNEISGGIYNAYWKYELDATQQVNKKASQWLINYALNHDIRNHTESDSILIATNGTSACSYFFKKENQFMSLKYGDYEERYTYDWDYYISYATEIPPYQLKNGIWPPLETFYTINIENKPMVAFIRNKEKRVSELEY